MKTPDPAERSRYMEQEFGWEAFFVLSNLNRVNLRSRQLIANSLYESYYRPVDERTGRFAAMPADMRSRLLDVLTLEIISKVVNSIEDLGKVLIVAGKRRSQRQACWSERQARALHSTYSSGSGQVRAETLSVSFT